MDSLTNTTELEAVNTILSVMGESPVNTLDVEGDLYIERAQSALKEKSRAIQKKGWYFNRDYKWPMARNVDSKIPVASNMIEAVPDGDYVGKHYTKRGGFMYDLANRTFEFDAGITCTVTWFMDWPDLPEAARYYITICAARAAQERMVGSEGVHKFTQDDEVRAHAELVREHLRMARPNSFSGNYTITKMLRNRRI